MSFTRFTTAQDSLCDGFDIARAELSEGRKTSHWIWYIFPQLAGLGRSPTAQFYGLKHLAEARDYLRDPTLGKRLFQITDVVAEKLAQGIRLTALMGGTTDSLKLVSSLTLFEAAARTLPPDESPPGLAEFVQRCGEILTRAEQQGFDRCRVTLNQIGVASGDSETERKP